MLTIPADESTARRGARPATRGIINQGKTIHQGPARGKNEVRQPQDLQSLAIDWGGESARPRQPCRGLSGGRFASHSPGTLAGRVHRRVLPPANRRARRGNPIPQTPCPSGALVGRVSWADRLLALQLRLYASFQNDDKHLVHVLDEDELEAL